MQIVVPKLNDEKVACTLMASYGMGGVGATNLLPDLMHKKGGVMEIRRCR